MPISYGAVGVIQVANSAFNAMGKPVPAVAIMVVRMFVLYVPLAYVGSWLAGPSGIFVAALVANLLAGLAAYGLSRRVCVLKPAGDRVPQEAASPSV